MDKKNEIEYDFERIFNILPKPAGLTEQEKREIREWLESGLRPKPAPEKVEAFLVELNNFLSGTRDLIGLPLSSPSNKAHIDKILKALEKVIEKVELMYGKAPLKGRKKKTKDSQLRLPTLTFLIESDPRWKPLYEARERIKEEISAPPLKYYSNLKLYIVSKIDALFEKYFGKSTFYRKIDKKYQSGSPFFNIVCLSLCSLKLPSKAPDRLISTVQKLKTAPKAKN